MLLYASICSYLSLLLVICFLNTQKVLFLFRKYWPLIKSFLFLNVVFIAHLQSFAVFAIFCGEYFFQFINIFVREGPNETVLNPRYCWLKRKAVLCLLWVSHCITQDWVKWCPMMWFSKKHILYKYKSACSMLVSSYILNVLLVALPLSYPVPQQIFNLWYTTIKCI